MNGALVQSRASIALHSKSFALASRLLASEGRDEAAVVYAFCRRADDAVDRTLGTFHWRRYVRERADRVEMWSHVGILVGHGTMMTAWWVWFFAGYPGVKETLASW
ncbi:MAG TPA: squalene/phytoene synthase family protein [Polyangiaceae bacterium]|nr:squalene/phytoene synthase family protein [Polyangiaceae bacterium]